MNDLPHANDGQSEPIDTAIGQKLREQRLLTGVSQVELGDMLKLSAHQVQRYETGADRISAVTLLRAANALGVEPAVLLPRHADEVGSGSAA